MSMFVFKKTVSQLFFPVPLCLELLLAGLLLIWFTKRQRTGRALATLGVVLLALLSHSAVADLLLLPLESAYLPWSQPAPPTAGTGRESCNWVVVLAGGYTPDERLPLSSRPGGSTLARLVEGIRVHQSLPGSQLLLSVGDGVTPDNEAESMTRLAEMLGAAPGRVCLIRGARDTQEEMHAIQRRVGSEPFVLVTSASHMPRAMAWAHSTGLNPTPAPTDYRGHRKSWQSPGDFFPDAEGLRCSERAIYEYLGWAWAKVLRQTPR
jgi:uncharacterized SAM-binding protein YcdF (DUF218 family)